LGRRFSVRQTPLDRECRQAIASIGRLGRAPSKFFDGNH
jgi:hypothetical protein